jgi:hypothetical protein
VKKSIYRRYGGFNIKYKIGADYGLMLRFLVKCGISTHYVPRVFVKMRVGGSSNGDIMNVIKANIECYRAWKECDLNISPFIIFRKLLSKLIQFKTASGLNGSNNMGATILRLPEEKLKLTRRIANTEFYREESKKKFRGEE